MANVTSLRHVSLGAYLPADSFVHRLDGRSKLVGAALLLAAILALPADWTTAAALAGLLALAALARLPLRHLAATLRPLLPMLAILAALQLAFGAAPASAEGVAADWPARLVAVLWGLLRLVDLMLLVGLLTSTTAEGALSTAMERLLAPLDAVKLPGSELAMVAGIALRFMPILGEEMESISAAHAARDVTARRTSRWRLAENALRSARLIVPLFVDVFRRIDEMTLAMMARCYGPLPGVRRRRTHLLAASLRAADYVALIVAAAALGLAVWA